MIPILDWIFEGVVQWIASIAAELMDAVSGLFLDALGTDMTAMEEYFPFVTKAYNILQVTAWAILILIVIWQLFRAFGGPITEAENPWHLLIRGAIFAFLIGYAEPIFTTCLSIARAPYTSLMDVPMTGDAFTFAGVEQALKNGLTTIVAGTSIVGLILILILEIALGWNYFKLLLETVERYIVVGVLCYTSPLAFSVGGSKTTNNVFKSWCRMVGSQLLLLVMNVWFLRGFSSSVGQFIGNGGVLSTGNGSLFLWLFCTLAYLKCAQRFDSYLASMGLNVAQTGSSMGMELMMAARVLTGVGSGARSAGNVFSRGGSTATGTGAAATGFAAGFASKFSPNSYVRDAVVDGGSRMGFGGGAGFVARAFGGMAARNGAELNGNSISSVAGRSPNASGMIAGDIADRSLSNYMPHMKGMKMQGTQISGGHISTTATTQNGKKASVDMFSTSQYEKPDVPHSVVTAADGSQWYQIASGEGKGAFYDAPVFQGAASDAQKQPSGAEAAVTAGSTDIPGNEMQTDMVNGAGATLEPQAAAMPGEVSVGTPQTEKGGNTDGGQIPQPDGSIPMPQSESGNLADTAGASANSMEMAFPGDAEIAPGDADLIQSAPVPAEMPVPSDPAVYDSNPVATEMPQHEGLSAEAGVQSPGMENGTVLEPTGVGQGNSMPEFAGVPADISPVAEAGGVDVAAIEAGQKLTDGVPLEAPSAPGQPGGDLSITDGQTTAHDYVPHDPEGTSGAFQYGNAHTDAGVSDTQSNAQVGSPGYGGDQHGSQVYDAGFGYESMGYAEAPLVAATFPSVQDGTMLRTVDEGIIEASAPNGGGNTLWYNSAYYQEPDAPHSVIESANGVQWYAMQQQGSIPEFEWGEEAQTYNRALFQQFMPGYDAQVSMVDGDSRQDGQFEVRHPDGSGTRFYDVARYAAPRGDYQVFEDARGSQWYAIPGEAAVDRKPVFQDGKPVYENDRLKTVNVESVRYRTTPNRFAEPEKRGDIERKTPRRKNP